MSDFTSRLEQVKTNVERELMTWLTLLATAGQTYIFNEVNMQLAIGFAASFQEILERSGYKKLISEFNTEAAAFLQDYINQREILIFTKTDLNTFKALQRVDYTELMGIGRRAGDILQTNIMSAVLSGEDLKNVHAKLYSVLDNTLKGYTQTYITTSRRVLMQKAEDLSAEHYKDENRWEYVGPRDNKNRPECIEGLKKQYFTDAERKQFEEDYGLRWNCRHIFQLVLEDDARQSVK